MLLSWEDTWEHEPLVGSVRGHFMKSKFKDVRENGSDGKTHGEPLQT